MSTAMERELNRTSNQELCQIKKYLGQQLVITAARLECIFYSGRDRHRARPEQSVSPGGRSHGHD